MQGSLNAPLIQTASSRSLKTLVLRYTAVETVTPQYTYALNANKTLRGNVFTEVMKTACLMQDDHTGDVLKEEMKNH